MNRPMLIDEMTTTLERVDSALAIAEDGLARGQLVDLTDLDRQIEAVCAGVGRLAPAEGRRLIPALESLMGRCDRLADGLRRTVDQWRDVVAEPPTPARASAAYRDVKG